MKDNYQYYITYHLGEDKFYIGKNKFHCDLCELGKIGPANIVIDGSEEIDGIIRFAFGYESKTIPKKLEIYKKFKEYYDKKFSFTFDQELIDEYLFKRLKGPFNYVLKTPYILDEKDILIEVF